MLEFIEIFFIKKKPSQQNGNGLDDHYWLTMDLFRMFASFS